MEKFTVEFPAVAVNVESRDVVLACNLAALPHDIIRQLLPHAIKQKVADAASGVVGALWQEVKGKDAPRPSRDQLRDFAETHEKRIKEDTLAAMGKAWDALVEGRWVIREASGGTSSKWTEEQSIALDIAKGALTAIFANALAKASPGTKPTAANFVALGDKVAAFFKANEKRPTWDDKAVMDWIKRQLDAPKPRDFMAEAREELARRAAAVEEMGESLDDMLADL